MRYFLAIILPPAAVLLCGKPIQFVLNCILTLCLWIPGMIHALMVVSGHKADKRTDRIVRAINASNRPTTIKVQGQKSRSKSSAGPSFDFLEQ
jgi:uncharacterized membrane protein YqaE (UPF0057 family)